MGRCHKLQDLWQVSYVIIKKHSDLDYELQTNQKGSKTVVHHDKLKKCQYEIADLSQWLVRAKAHVQGGNPNQN